MIETERLLLRGWRDADVEPYMHALNTPAVRRHLGPLQSRDEVVAAVRRMQALEAERGFCFWIAERRSDGLLLGFCGLKLVNAAGTDLTGTHEIGWQLREEVWGQGYAREAATAALDFAFDRLTAPEVVAFTVAGNTASWGLMQRLGMTRRADLDYHDPAYGPELNPTIVYRIAREEWRA